MLSCINQTNTHGRDEMFVWLGSVFVWPQYIHSIAFCGDEFVNLCDLNSDFN